MAASGSVFAGRPRTGSKLPAHVDVDGNEAEVGTKIDNDSY